MDKKRLVMLLTASIFITGFPWTHTGYAAERNDILVETVETMPDKTYEETVNDDYLSDTVVSETHSTTPVDPKGSGSGEGETRPDGVVKMTVRTTSVEAEAGNEGKDDKGTEVMEITGRSSIPDPSEIGLYAEDVVNMVLPVIPDDTYDFVMDADDLLSRFSEYSDSYEPASLYFTNSSGEKSHTGISDIAMARNKSSVPVLLYVTLQVENGNEWPVRYTDMDSVEEDEENNISFAIIPVSANCIAETDAEPEEPQDDTEEDKEDAGYTMYRDKMISIDENGKAEMILYLPGTKDNFEVINDKYMAKENAIWSSLGFAITGACNTRADWKDMNERSMMGESLGIHITYRMDTLTEEQHARIDEGYGPDEECGVIIFE